MPNDLTLPQVSQKSLPALLRKRLVPEQVDVYGEFGWEGRRLVGYGLSGDVIDAEREQAIAILTASLRPCRPEVAIRALARLHAATKSRRGAATDDAMLIDVLGDVLCEYPEDAVIMACEQWRASNVFFPAEAELRKLLDAAVAERKLSLKAFLMAKPVDDKPLPPERVKAKEVDAIIERAARKAGVPREQISAAKPEQAITPVALAGQSEMQMALEGLTPEQRKAYVLEKLNQ